MKFGISLGNPPHTRSLALLRAAEAADFDQIWIWDSHIIWYEAYSLMGWLIGQSRSERLEWGTCVTNPVTRDPLVAASAFATLNQITGGRVICGIGRGDSALRVNKRRPANLAALERAVHDIRAVGLGEPVDSGEGTTSQMPWAEGGTRVYVAGYGPKALRLAGRVADGVIFQIADPYVIEWGMRFVREGAEEAGKDPDDITIHVATTTFISEDLDEACDQTRWFGAVVGNHIADVLRHHGAEDLPDALVDYVGQRGHYDYRHHGEQGTEHSQYVPNEIVERFCVIGGPDRIRERLRELEAIGVSEFNIYPNFDNVEEVLDRYGREFVPEFRATTA